MLGFCWRSTYSIVNRWRVSDVQESYCNWFRSIKWSRCLIINSRVAFSLFRTTGISWLPDIFDSERVTGRFFLTLATVLTNTKNVDLYTSIPSLRKQTYFRLFPEPVTAGNTSAFAGYSIPGSLSFAYLGAGHVTTRKLRNQHYCSGLSSTSFTE